MMKYWTIVYPDHNILGEEYTHWETLSEEDNLEDYWEWWYLRMCMKFGKENVDKNYSPQDCIDDWCVVHWAQRNYWREMKECIQ